MLSCTTQPKQASLNRRCFYKIARQVCVGEGGPATGCMHSNRQIHCCYTAVVSARPNDGTEKVAVVPAQEEGMPRTTKGESMAVLIAPREWRDKA